MTNFYYTGNRYSVLYWNIIMKYTNYKATFNNGQNWLIFALKWRNIFFCPYDFIYLYLRKLKQNIV